MSFLTSPRSVTAKQLHDQGGNVSSQPPTLQYDAAFEPYQSEDAVYTPEDKMRKNETVEWDQTKQLAAAPCQQLIQFQQHTVYREHNVLHYVDSEQVKIVPTEVKVPLRRRIPQLCSSVLEHEIIYPKITLKLKLLMFPFFCLRSMPYPHQCPKTRMCIPKQFGLSISNVTMDKVDNVQARGHYVAAFEHFAVAFNV